MSKLIEIEVAYALPWKQVLQPLKVPHGTTAEQAVLLSKICKVFPEINMLNNDLGVYGKLIKPDTILHDHDRVEIYRQLTVDPKEKRKTRAEKSTTLEKNK